MCSFGPMYVQRTPPRSLTGYALSWILSLKLLSDASDGMSVHLPSTSYFQPW